MAASVTSATAGDRGPIDHDFQLSSGGFFTDFDTGIRLDGEAAGTGTEIDWEHEFDLGGDYHGRIKLSYGGPLAYLTVGF